MIPQYVDLEISEAKFNREIAEFRTLEGDYAQRGWFLVRADFPNALVLLAAPGVTPPPLICGVAFDFTNYDAEPPSVHLVNPFTGAPYLARELPTSLNRSLPPQRIPVPGAPDGNLEVRGTQPLMQATQPDEVPFLCIAGVREYHDHPGHSGDPWTLHRREGAGRLVRLLEVIHKYGIEPIRGYGVNLVPQVGLDFGEPPE